MDIHFYIITIKNFLFFHLFIIIGSDESFPTLNTPLEEKSYDK